MKLRIVNFLKRIHQESDAATTVEYALLLALIMVFCISGILSTGDVQEVLWFETSEKIKVINQ